MSADRTARSVSTPGPASGATPSAGRRVAVALLLVVTVTAVAAVGALSNAPNTDGWYASVEKVPWSPPNWLFAPVWTVLYLSIALTGYLLWRRGFAGPGRPSAMRRQLTLFVSALVLNALWSPVFFAGYPLVGVAAWWGGMAIMVLLIVNVVVLAFAARSVSVVAAVLQVPYLAWLCLAASLNAGIILRN